LGLGVIDSGAGLSLVSEEVIVHIQNLWPKRLVVHPCDIAFQGVNKLAITTLGITKLNFQLGREKYTHWFLITKDLPYDLILGNNFMSAIDAHLSVRQSMVLIQGKDLICGSCKPNDSVLLRTMKKVVLPPKSRSFMAVTHEPILWASLEGHNYVVEPFTLTNRMEFAVEPQVTSLGNDWFKISVVNSSANELEVEQGLVITRMTPTAGPAMVMTLFAGGSTPYTEPESQASQAAPEQKEATIAPPVIPRVLTREQVMKVSRNTMYMRQPRTEVLLACPLVFIKDIKVKGEAVKQVT